MSGIDTLVPALGGVSADAEARCAHCLLPVPRSMHDPTRDDQFCCAGCHAVWQILHDHGLTGYYHLPERREIAVTSTGRRYEEYDHDTFTDLYVRVLPDGSHEVDLYLEGIHCSACVWLVERIPRTLAGVLRAEVNLTRSRATVAWDPAAATLSTIARWLDTLGYPPHPFRGIRAETIRRREDREMIVRIGVAGALAANVMLLALALYSGWFGNMDPVFTRYFRWVSLLVTTPALLWPGRVFFRGALAALRARALHMDVPIALALAAGFGRGLWNTVADSGPVYFDGVAPLIFLLLVGRFLQQRAQRAAADSAELLHAVAPSTARTVDGEDVREIPAEALLPGMTIVVYPGETVAADGIVSAGTSALNMALLSGESRPVPVGPGDPAWAGTVNLSAPLRLRVEQAGEASRVGRMLREVAESAARRAPVVDLTHRLAGAFVAAVLLLAVVTAGLWWSTSPTMAIDHAIALLIVTCPCALALATPLAVSVAIGRAARAGILIKGGDALEILGRGAAGGTLFLDKTGTLTVGSPRLLAWSGPDAVRPWVLALEGEAAHPVAAGFREAWSGLPVPSADTVEHVLGGGVAGRVEGHDVMVGSPSWIGRRLDVTPRLAGGDSAHLTPVLVAVDGVIVGEARFGDAVRPEAGSVVSRLREEGWAVHLLTGDNRDVAHAVGASLGFADDVIHAEQTPEAKAERVAVSQAGPTVMVGDGVNDAAALARATVGIAVHGGAEASMAVADVYLSTPGVGSLVPLMAGARRTLATIKRNVVFSLLYNVAGAGLAMAGLLHPLVAAILMPHSSLTVIVHSWRSRSFEAAEHP